MQWIKFINRLKYKLWISLGLKKMIQSGLYFKGGWFAVPQNSWICNLEYELDYVWKFKVGRQSKMTMMDRHHLLNRLRCIIYFFRLCMLDGTILKKRRFRNYTYGSLRIPIPKYLHTFSEHIYSLSSCFLFIWTLEVQRRGRG